MNGGGELARTLGVARGNFSDVHHNALIARATDLHGDSNHIGKAFRRLGFLPRSFFSGIASGGSDEAIVFCHAVAARFDVAVSSVVKWRQRYRATGSVAPGKMGGHRKPILEPHRAFIAERISQTPHLTLHALQGELAARGVKVSHNAVWLFLRREGLRFKKNAVRS